MPSKYSVALSLDEASMALWEGLPVGERSKRVREALETADIVKICMDEICDLKEQVEMSIRTIRKLRLEILNLETFGVKE